MVDSPQQASSFEIDREQARSLRTSSAHSQEAQVNGKTSTFSTTMSLSTAMVGAGVLGLPRVFADAGWIAAPPFLLFCASIMAESGMAMSKALAHLHESGPCPKTYEDVAEAAGGPRAKWAARVVFCWFMLSFSAVLIILVGQGLETITNVWQPYRIWVLAVYPFFLIVALVGNMRFFSAAAFIGVLASIFYVLSIVQSGIMAGASMEKVTYNRAAEKSATDVIIWSLAPVSFVGIGQVLAIMLFGFGYQYMLPSLRSEMANPNELPRAIWGSIFIGLFFYMAVGVAGYYGWGDAVESQVATTMDDEKKCHCEGAWFKGGALSVAVCINVIITFPIVMEATCKGVEGMLGIERSVPARVGLVTLAVAVGLLCPYFFEVVGVITSLLGTSIFLFFPLAIHCGVQRQSCASWTGIKYAVVIIGGAFAFVFGLYQSFSDLGRKMGEGGGNPFTHFMDPLKK